MRPGGGAAACARRAHGGRPRGAATAAAGGGGGRGDGGAAGGGGKRGVRPGAGDAERPAAEMAELVQALTRRAQLASDLLESLQRLRARAASAELQLSDRSPSV